MGCSNFREGPEFRGDIFRTIARIAVFPPGRKKFCIPVVGGGRRCSAGRLGRGIVAGRRGRGPVGGCLRAATIQPASDKADGRTGRTCSSFRRPGRRFRFGRRRGRRPRRCGAVHPSWPVRRCIAPRHRPGPAHGLVCRLLRCISSMSCTGPRLIPGQRRPARHHDSASSIFPGQNGQVRH